MAQVYVIDPGMREEGGHHAALISTLLGYKELESIGLTLISHQLLDSALLSRASKSGVEVVKHFNTNFYENYDTAYSVGNPQIQSYIRTLASEYVEAWCIAIAKHSNTQKITFFYPCLNYDHAAALNLAFLYLAQNKPSHLANCTHKICCMFTPNNVHDVLGNFRYGQAFSALSKKKGVQLYASDIETLQYYEGLNVQLKGIHPCYLLPWEQIEVSYKHPGQPPCILLYFGDAKMNKGFCSVPGLVSKLLSDYNENVTLLIQYTLAWEHAELQQTIEALNKLSAKHEQVHLFNEFWDPDKLVEKFGTLDTIYCTYNPRVYQYKSSGLAWLASFFSIPVVLNGRCWLSREFDRIGHRYSFEAGSHTPPAAIDTQLKESGYFDCLFKNLITWLKS
ncbi:hypothetical protein GTH32_10995 [Alteromonas sp. 345S023]|uniref:Glycosyltransferase family 1 protein n=1 Tax=Alteromonas profundi TaxID=2696062 RepID=A0A7X5RLQ0_9ALTE|nr:hypothetical protein [Alteromonas profundi]NDV91710.1 hypothetical protein [Alteromonas profundi]